ncbi:MAG: DUF2569 family protein [Acidobacteria bacterium]|nr:DUF2569 family protein [Acidobacteriota bacterium]
MMTQDTLADLKIRIARMQTDDLIKMVNIDFAQYRKEAIELAQAELEARGVPIDLTTAPLPKIGTPTKRNQLDPEKCKNLGGWLYFLVICLMILWPLFGLGNVRQTDDAYHKFTRHNPVPDGLDTYIDIGRVTIYTLAAFSFLSGLLLARKRRFGITLTKWFLITNATTAIAFPFVILWLNSKSEVMQIVFKEDLRGGLGALIISAGWYAYLVFSKRVKLTYGLNA